jgi:hypothetical protein
MGNKSIFDYFINENNEFDEWNNILVETPFDSSKQVLSNVVVDTSETIA